MNALPRLRSPMSVARPMTPMSMVCAMALASLMLAGCATSPPSPPLMDLAGVRLPAPARAAPAAGDAAVAWRLAEPVGLPAALDRDSVLVSPEPGRLQAWMGLRWAEPLRDALPRLLAEDLSALRAAPVLASRSPAAAGLPAATPTLRVDLLRWQALPAEGRVSLQARWTLASPAGGPPHSGEADLQQAWAPATPAALVAAQRQLLAKLARSIAGTPAMEQATTAQPAPKPASTPATGPVTSAATRAAITPAPAATPTPARL